MAKPNMVITFEIEPIVKLTCLTHHCEHNLMEFEGISCCNLKHVVINPTNYCNQFKPRRFGRAVKMEGGDK